MGQCDTAIRLVVVDGDENFQAELRALKNLGIEVVIVDAAGLAGALMPETGRDVVVVSVETPPALALVATTCKQHMAPPVIAIGGAGFERKSLEHILLLAEVRGAIATLPKPIEPADLVMSARMALKRTPQHGRRMAHEPAVTRNQLRAR